MSKILEWPSGILAYLYDHEPVRTGFVAQWIVGGSTAWLIGLAGQLHLPGDLDKGLAGLIGLLGAAAITYIDAWKRSRVSSAATSAKLAASPVPTAPPIPLAEDRALIPPAAPPESPRP